MSGNSLAGPEKQKRHGDDMQRVMRGVMAKLDLSEQQKVQIKEIQSAKMAQLKALKPAEKVDKKPQLQALITADTFDETAFVLMQEQRAAKLQQVGLISAKSMHKIYHVLNVEQQAKFSELLAKQKRKHQRGKKRPKNQPQQDESEQ